MWKTFKSSIRNEDGHVAVIFALASLPLAICVSAAVDMHRSESELRKLQYALDTATLAAVTKGTMDEAQRGEHAKLVFHKNFRGDLAVKLLEPKVTGDIVSLKATGTLPTTLSGMVGISEMEISRQSTSQLIKETITCLLVLAPSERGALVFEGNSVFNSPDCAIQVNSTHNEALLGNSSQPPIAKDVCVTGGYSGQIGTHVKTECRPIEDPYKDVNIPKPGPCDYIPGVALDKPIMGGWLRSEQFTVSNMTEDYYTVLNPGNYCGGILLRGKIKFRPGIYHITDGAFLVGGTADIVADDVTFILSGDNSRLHMKAGAKVDITASHDGELGGIAFFQVPYTNGETETLSVVRSGSDLKVNGVFYFPTHEIQLQGTADVGAKAQATSFIAHKLKIYSDVRTTINVDYEAAGLPPLHPRTDEGARLISN